MLSVVMAGRPTYVVVIQVSDCECRPALFKDARKRRSEEPMEEGRGDPRGEEPEGSKRLREYIQ